MLSLTHAQVLAMMELQGTVWVERHAAGLAVDISVESTRSDPCVYAWVSEGLILYIGKAGNGLRRRMVEHARGMKSSTRGASHADFLAELTDRGRIVMLYALWPEPVPFAGHMIASHSSVEDWLVSVIAPKPARNR